MPRLLILIAVIMLTAALWVVKPFKGMYDPIEVELPPTDTRVAVGRTYGPPHSVQAGAAYRRARAKRIMRPASTYPTHIADRYYAELSLYMRKMSGEKEGQILFPSASMLRNMEVSKASEKDCDNPRSRYNNPVEFRGLTIYMDGAPKKNKCEWSTTRYAKYLKRFSNGQTKVEVSECSWELLVPDLAVLDMAHLYKYEPNAAFLCLITLNGDRNNPTETVGYFAKRGHNDWIYMGGFDDVNIPLRRVRLDPAIMKDPEGEARRRWAALPR